MLTWHVISRALVIGGILVGFFVAAYRFQKHCSETGNIWPSFIGACFIFCVALLMVLRLDWIGAWLK